jgi:hypothetical protein
VSNKGVPQLGKVAPLMDKGIEQNGVANLGSGLLMGDGLPYRNTEHCARCTAGTVSEPGGKVLTIIVPNKGFADLLAAVAKLRHEGNQNLSRHYSETLSKGVALWLRGLLVDDGRFHEVLPPEAKVPTCFGKKSLDVACRDKNKYLALDLSIKTFSFVDPRTRRYDKNYTGRFYELLGEGLDLRLSYPEAVLVALIFLPLDSCSDGTKKAPSSFGKAVKQYSKIASKGSVDDHALSFEHVFVGLYDEDGVAFFDAQNPPPFHDEPPAHLLMSTEQMLEKVLKTVTARAPHRKKENMHVQPSFRWA